MDRFVSIPTPSARLSSSGGAAARLYDAALRAHGDGRHAEATGLLSEAAKGGHAPAMRLLGAQLLTGRGVQPDPMAGVRWTLAAAQAGSAEACTLAATLAAVGADAPPDWGRALDWLQRGAELGDAKAQGQLQVLAGRPPAADGWAGLRRVVDLDAWLAPVAATTLCDAPLIQAWPGFASPAACAWMVERARPLVHPAQVYDAEAGGGRRADDRSNGAADLDIAQTDLVFLLVRARMAAAAGTEPAALEAAQVLHYRMGQRFAPHFDFLDADQPGYAADIAARGQRASTVLLYLNAGYEGGETDFPTLGLRHRGAAGDALHFRNLDAAGRPDRRTLHAGLAPTRGEKWLLSQWVRDRASYLA